MRLTCSSIVSKTSIIESINVYVHVRARARARPHARALTFRERISVRSFADFERVPKELMLHDTSKSSTLTFVSIEFERESDAWPVILDYLRCVFKI